MSDLQKYIEAENAKWIAECEANGATWYTTTVSDPAHWAEMDVFTVEDYKRSQLISYISDAHKEAYGFRPRGYDWDNMSMDELSKWSDELSEECAREFEREEARKAERPEIDGGAVIAHLGIEPGPQVGRALRFLLELKRAEGALGEQAVFERLDVWWADNQP